MLENLASMFRSENTYTELSAREAAARLAEMQIVDVRGPDEFAGPLGHIPGARCLPLDVLEAQLQKLDRARPILAVCRSGRRSARACQVLHQNGFDELHNLSGGMLSWNALGLTREHGEDQTRDGKDNLTC